MSLEFYTNPMSRGRIVRWMMEEVGAPYETHVIQYGPDMKGEAYRSINPMGKVPAIRHNGKVVTECAAICAYMADAFPEAGLAPPPADRADYYRWLFFTAGAMEPAITSKSLGFEPNEEQSATAGFGSKELVIDVLERSLTGKSFIAGDRFSAADLYLAAQLGFGMQFNTIEARDVFVDYHKRMTDRPAFARATEIDDALMPTGD